MAALIIAIFPQNSSRGNREEQQDRTDPNSRFELTSKPAWLLAFQQFGLPKWKHDFECGSLRPLRYASKKGICGEQDNPDARIALFQWRCHPDLNRGMKVLQTFALPLGYGTQ